MDNNIVSTVNGILGPSNECIARTYSQTKEQIEKLVKDFIDDQLQYFESADLYVHFKQLEHAIKTGLDYLKKWAFDSIGQYLGGVPSGRIFGHHVAISYPHQWEYSGAVEELKSKQKTEMVILQETEKATGLAKKVQGAGRITVTLTEK